MSPASDALERPISLSSGSGQAVAKQRPSGGKAAGRQLEPVSGTASPAAYSSGSIFILTLRIANETAAIRVPSTARLGRQATQRRERRSVSWVMSRDE